MIKNIIIDLDNTIIKDEEEDALYYKNALSAINLNENDYIKIYESIDRYEKSLTENNAFYDRRKIIDFINNDLGTNYPYELIEYINNEIAVNWSKKERVLIPKNVIEYLYQKYCLYVFTDYFQDIQEKRLENIGYLKYFKKVFGADKYGVKPFKKSFERAKNDEGLKENECIYIGDNKDVDIRFAYQSNIKSILFDYNEKRDDPNIHFENYTYFIMKDWNEIQEILKNIENI